MSWLPLLCLALFLSQGSEAAEGFAPSGRFNIGQKVQKKEAGRWTLEEWLAQKERNRLMDLWLAMYAPSPYEFFIEGSFQSFETKPTSESNAESHQSYRGGVGAYATVIGLEGLYENNTQEKLNDLSGSLNLRILGNAVQGTHLILHYGLRTREFQLSETHQRIANTFAGADLNLYLTRHFGLSGLYDVYLPTDHSTLGEIKGSRAEAGFFIDFAAVRLLGSWFSDIQTQAQAGSEISTVRTGAQAGLAFFF